MEERRLAESGAKGGDMSMALVSCMSLCGDCCCCRCLCGCRCWCGLWRRRLAPPGPNGWVARTGPVCGWCCGVCVLGFCTSFHNTTNKSLVT